MHSIYVYTDIGLKILYTLEPRGFLAQNLTQKSQKRLLIGSACSKDLTCAPRGSPAFGSPVSVPFVSKPGTSWFQGNIHRLSKNEAPPIYFHQRARSKLDNPRAQ